MDQTWSQTDHIGQNAPYGPKRTRYGSKRTEKSFFTDLIFCEHISEEKWNKNAARWTRHGPKRILWFKMEHMGLNGPDTGPNGLEIEENPSLLAWSFVIAFLKRNGTEMRQDGPNMVPKDPMGKNGSYGPKRTRYRPKQTGNWRDPFYTGLIFCEHIFEHKWNRNAARWTRHGPKWTIWAKMIHMDQKGPIRV